MNERQKQVHEQIKQNLIVSCQALADEPLHSPTIMGRMAIAAKEGGAKAIRANSIADIREIKQQVDLPIIGLMKADFDDSAVFITPREKEVDLLYQEGVDIIATDATNRIRPGGKTLEEFFIRVRKKYPNQLFMADCASFEEAEEAEKLGFDYIGTTLHGYTEETKGASLPNMELLDKMITNLSTPVIAEGGIWTPDQLKQALKLGAHSVVVGSAITRPQEITKRFVQTIK